MTYHVHVGARVILLAFAAVATTGCWWTHEWRHKLACAPTPNGAFPAVEWIGQPPAGPNWVIGTVGDGYDCAIQDQLSDTVERLNRGSLAVSPFKERRDLFALGLVKAVSAVENVSTPTVRRDTALKVVFNNKQDECFFTETDESDRLIAAAVRDIPYLKTIWVLAKTEGDEGGGCARGNLVYLANGAGSWDMGHELGHAAGGLRDEYGDAGHYPGPTVEGPNCSSSDTIVSEPWKSLVKTLGPPTKGCLGYQTGAYRPSHACRMKRDTFFCEVCKRVLETTFDEYERRAPGPNDVYAQLIVRITEGAGCSLFPGQICVQVLAARTFQGAVPTRLRNTSPFLFEVAFSGQTLAVGPLTFQRLERRAMDLATGGRGTGAEREQLLPGDSAIFVFHIPGVAAESLPQVSVFLHELARPGVEGFIDREVLARLKTSDGLRTTWTASPAPMPQ